jgi:hypothetical protein
MQDDSDGELGGGDMSSEGRAAGILEDVKVDVKVKLSALWVALMFLYLYNDVFSIYRKDFVEEVLTGEVGGMEITQVFMLGAAMLMAVSILMVFLALALPARVNRWTNIVVGVLLLALLLATLLVPGDLWAYYAFYMVLEAVLLTLIVWHAWKWPRQEQVEATA